MVCPGLRPLLPPLLTLSSPGALFVLRLLWLLLLSVPRVCGVLHVAGLHGGSGWCCRADPLGKGPGLTAFPPLSRCSSVPGLGRQVGPISVSLYLCLSEPGAPGQGTHDTAPALLPPSPVHALSLFLRSLSYILLEYLISGLRLRLHQGPGFLCQQTQTQLSVQGCILGPSETACCPVTRDCALGRLYKALLCCDQSIYSLLLCSTQGAFPAHSFLRPQTTCHLGLPDSRITVCSNNLFNIFMGLSLPSGSSQANSGLAPPSW